MTPQPKPSSPCPWIRAEDFVNTNLAVTVTNTTTSTQVNPAQVELTGLGEKELSLRLPSQTCAVGQFLAITIVTSRGDTAGTKIEATAKVLDKEKFDLATSLVTVRFYQFDEKQWLSFLKSLASRQDQVNQQVRKIKE
jgi:hypothetical protein